MSIFENLKNWLADNLSSQNVRQDKARIDSAPENGPIRSGEHYFRIWLQDMRLGRNRRWFTDFFPATHSLIELEVGGRKAEIANLVGPRELGEGVDQSNIGQSVVVNQVLTPLIPFNGGVVTINAGLVSIPATGGLPTTLNIVSAFAKQLNVPQVTKVLELADTVAGSIGQLLQISGPAVQLNYSEGFSAQGGGHWADSRIVVAGVAEGTLDGGSLWVKDGRLAVGASEQDAGPLDDCDYLLFHIERVDARDDWDQFDAIAQPIKAALNAALEGDSEAAKAHEKVARAAVIGSADLTRADKARTVREIGNRVAAYGLTEGPQPAADVLALDTQDFMPEILAGVPASEVRAEIDAEDWEERALIAK